MLPSESTTMPPIVPIGAVSWNATVAGLVSATPAELFTTSVVPVQLTTVNCPLFAEVVNPLIVTTELAGIVGEKLPVYVVVPLDAVPAAVSESVTVTGPLAGVSWNAAVPGLVSATPAELFTTSVVPVQLTTVNCPLLAEV